MGRSITISTPVFAAIWRERKEGEETEDAILTRLLGIAAENLSVNEDASKEMDAGGVYDSRNSVYFPRGFKAFRRYKRRDYVAVAGDGVWIRQDTGETYTTLNQLNESIASGPENVWNGNWKFPSKDGTFQSLDTMRQAT